MKKRIFMLAVVVGLLVSLSVSAWADGDTTTYYYKLDSVTAPASQYEQSDLTNVSLQYTVSVGYTDTATDGYYANANLLKWDAENFTISEATIIIGSMTYADTSLYSTNYCVISPTVIGLSPSTSGSAINATITLTGSVTSNTSPVSVTFGLYTATDGSAVTSGTVESTISAIDDGDQDAADTTDSTETVYTDESQADYEDSNPLSITVDPDTLSVVIGSTDKTATITATNVLGDVTYASDTSWVTVANDTGVVTVAPTDRSLISKTNYQTVTITATDSGRTGTNTATATLSILVISHDVRDYDDDAWNGLDPAFTNTVSGDYDKAKPALGKVDKSNLSCTGGTPKNISVPMTGPITTLDVYVAAKDAIKLGWLEKGSTTNIQLTQANIKEYNIPFRVTSYDLKTTASGADAKARAKSWKSVTSTVTISFNGGNVQYKGFPITISMANKNTGSKPVAKTIKLDVTPVNGVPYWMQKVTVSKDTTTDETTADEWGSEDGQKATATYKTVYETTDIYTPYATDSDWGLTTYTKDEAFLSSDKKHYVVPTKMDTSDYIEVTPYTLNSDNYVYTAEQPEGSDTYVSGDILTDGDGNPVKVSAFAELTSYTKDTEFEYNYEEDEDNTTEHYIVPTYAKTEDILSATTTPYSTNSGNYIYTTTKKEEVDYYTLYADEYEAYDKKDKPEVVTWIDTTANKGGEFYKVFTASADGPYVITAKPDPTSTKDASKLTDFFSEGVEAITIVQPEYDYLGNVTTHGYVKIDGTPKNTDKENKLAITLTATNPSTKKKGALKVTAIAKTIPAFDKTTTIDGKKGITEKWITTKRVEAGKVPSVKFKAKGSKTIAYKLGSYSWEDGLYAEDEDYNTALAEKLTALKLSFDEKKGAVILASKSDKATLPTLNESEDAFESLDIVVTAYNNAGAAQAWGHVAITGAKPKMVTKNAAFDANLKDVTLQAKVGRDTASASTAGANVRFTEDPNSPNKLSDLGLTLYHWDTITVQSEDYGELDSTDYYAEGKVIYPFVAANVKSGDVTSKDATEYAKGYVFTEYPTLEYGEVKATTVTTYAAGATIDNYDETKNLNSGTVTESEGTYTVAADNVVYYADDSGTDTVYVVSTDVAYVLAEDGTSTLYYAGEGGVYYLNGEKYIGGLGTYTSVVSADSSYKNTAVLKVTNAATLAAKADTSGKGKDKKYTVNLILENLGATNKGKITVIVKGDLASSNGALPGSDKANAYSTAAANGTRTGNGTAAYSYNGALPDGADADAKADADAENSEKLTIGAPRTVADLTAGQQAFLAENGYKVVAVLPEITAEEAGQYDFDVELDEEAPEDAKLIWIAFPKNAPASEDDDIVDFYDEAGTPVEGVPASHKIIAYPWLREAVTYEPVIAIEAE